MNRSTHAKTSLLSLRCRLISLRERALDIRLRHLLEHRYDPSQPRIPAGSSGGGQWTGGGGSGRGSSATYRDVAFRTEREDDAPRPGRLSIASRKRLAQCEEQFERDIFHCNMVGIRECYAQAMVRKVACEKGHPIPPLNY